jgi:hypothetical protein
LEQVTHREGEKATTPPTATVHPALVANGRKGVKVKVNGKVKVKGKAATLIESDPRPRKQNKTDG